MSPSDFREMSDYVRAQRSDESPYDFVQIGQTADAADSAVVSETSAASATWWMEAAAPFSMTLDEMRARIHSGPPRV